MEEKKLTKKELNKIIQESADEFTKKVEESLENVSEEEWKELERIFAIEDPTERTKELQKHWPNIDGIGFCE